MATARNQDLKVLHIRSDHHAAPIFQHKFHDHPVAFGTQDATGRAQILERVALQRNLHVEEIGAGTRCRQPSQQENEWTMKFQGAPPDVSSPHMALQRNPPKDLARCARNAKTDDRSTYQFKQSVSMGK